LVDSKNSKDGLDWEKEDWNFLGFLGGGNIWLRKGLGNLEGFGLFFQGCLGKLDFGVYSRQELTLFLLGA